MLLRTIFFLLVLIVGLNSGLSIECLKHNNDQEGCFTVPTCAYCIQAIFTGNRCNLPLELKRTGCLEKHIIDQPNVNETLPIEPGTAINITVNFQLLKHPVDLYYLMDFSGSMSDDKASVVALSAELVNVVKNNMSTDFTIGFGVHVDKPVSPLGDPSWDFSFFNAYALSSAEVDLAALVNATEIRGGNDTPESQLDGMFQAVACTQIGWRENARRILLLATDAEYHKAGDGLVSGITTAFDGACHLSPEGYYTEETSMDYPSEEQIVTLMNDNQVNVIFAVSYVSMYYTELQSNITTSALGELSYDSSNIVELLVEQYNKIANRVSLEQTPVTDEVNIRYFSNCAGDSYEETTICESLAEDGSVTFIMEFNLEECPPDPKDWYQTVRINPIGLPYFFDIALNLLCKLP